MAFNSIAFLVFFAAFFALYIATQRTLRAQNVLLLGGSYLFYGWWDWRFLGLIVLSTLIDFSTGRILDKRRPDESYALSRLGRRAWLWLSLGANLGILGFFKYYNFFAESTAAMLDAIGLPMQTRLLEIALPVGISFYTFQTMSYSLDVYWGRMCATRSLLNFAVYVAYFPQLVAGPIMRAKDLLPQVEAPRAIAPRPFHEGGYLILWGLFKKVVIADNLAPLVDAAFSSSQVPFGGTVLVAVYAFAVQIYCDFSGYTDIARGVSKWLGIELCVNFEKPYVSGSPQEFWRRWHISLSSWLRDYLYIPLGGNRSGPVRSLINLMVVMVLGGLWHGAAWNFVLWGLFHGSLLVIYRVSASRMRSLSERFPGRIWSWQRPVAVFFFFQLTCLGWLIFRAGSLSQIWDMVMAIGTAWPVWIVSGAIEHPLQTTGALTLAVFVTPLILMHWLQRRHGGGEPSIFHWPAPIRGLAYSLMTFGVICFARTDGDSFIYFQF